MSYLFLPPLPCFSRSELARITGLQSGDIEKHLPGNIDLPSHRSINPQGIVVYTPFAAAKLADGLERDGLLPAAVSLRAELLQRLETPARALIAPRAKELYVREGRA
jgi:alkylated DNA nucleotide flippase Atl1